MMKPLRWQSGIAFLQAGTDQAECVKATVAAVYNNGRSILDFPEAWGEDLMDVSSADVENIVKKLRPSFGL